jgi:hypothetical protein
MGGMNCSNWQWRIASTEAGLQYGAFFQVGLPVPTIAPAYDGSGETASSVGSQFIHGYKRLEMMFARLDNPQWFALRKLVADAQAGTLKYLYMTIDWSNGEYAIPHWIDVRGYPHRPLMISDPGSLIGRLDAVHYYDNVQFILNNITIVNDPSLYSEQ